MTGGHSVFNDSVDARAFREYQVRLGKASTPAEAGRAMVYVLRKTVEASIILFYPLYRGADPNENMVLFVKKVDRDSVAQAAVAAFPKAEQELEFISSYLRETERTRDVMRYHGRKKLMTSPLYEEFLRPCKIEHMLSAFMATKRPSAVAYLTITRTADEPPFTADDIARLEAIRLCAEQTLCRMLESKGESSTSSQILNVLSAGLPQASALLDAEGALVWANRAAEQKLGEQVLRISGHFLLYSRNPVIDNWRNAVREAVSVREETVRVDRHLAVNRIDRPGKTPLYLVVDTEVSAESDSEWKTLSAREREIAELAAQGFTPINIGLKLFISPGTVRNHLKSIYRKLGITSRVELALKLIP